MSRHNNSFVCEIFRRSMITSVIIFLLDWVLLCRLEVSFMNVLEYGPSYVLHLFSLRLSFRCKGHKRIFPSLGIPFSPPHTKDFKATMLWRRQRISHYFNNRNKAARKRMLRFFRTESFTFSIEKHNTVYSVQIFYL